VTTRPIKGTRPISTPASDLLDSAKDQAELNMIVDLMRNDLGRVCSFASVRVDEARRVETHAVHHTVATISGTLAPGRTLTDLLLSAFPGGSVTGAPKVRAMQIIEEIEPSPRGIYCGSIVLADAAGNLTASITIRTASIGRGVLTYPVGAGIVADSDPTGEWRETLDKAASIVSLQSPLASVAGSTLRALVPGVRHASASGPA
jgi:para-aminobenzoate synthetase component 1